MGEIKNGILGGVSGKVGTVVGTNWRGKNIIRVLPRKSGKKASKTQLEQRSKFKLVSEFLRPLNPLVSRYFGAIQGAKSRVNLALSYHLQEAVEVQDDGGAIHLEKVILSKGVLPSVIMTNASLENTTLNLTWISYGAMALVNKTDLLTVVVFEKQQNRMLTFERVSTRDAGSYSIELPNGFESANCVMWYFLCNEADTECSTSVFMALGEENL